MEPIKVPDHDGIDGTTGDVGEQTAVFRSRFAAVRALVVVDIRVHHRPTAPLGEREAVLDLASHAQLIAVRIGRDPGIYRGGMRHPATLAHAYMARRDLSRSSPRSH